MQTRDRRGFRSNGLAAPGLIGDHEMINGNHIAIVLPAYNAEKTLEATVREIPDVVDTSILVDDGSTDGTVDLAHRLGLQVFVHDRNYGYGRNQQTCYREALAAGADVVIMLHPDYRYTPPAGHGDGESRSRTASTTWCWARASLVAPPFAAACPYTSTSSTVS